MAGLGQPRRAAARPLGHTSSLRLCTMWSHFTSPVPRHCGSQGQGLAGSPRPLGRVVTLRQQTLPALSGRQVFTLRAPPTVHAHTFPQTPCSTLPTLSLVDLSDQRSRCPSVHADSDLRPLSLDKALPMPRRPTPSRGWGQRQFILSSHQRFQLTRTTSLCLSLPVHWSWGEPHAEGAERGIGATVLVGGNLGHLLMQLWDLCEPSSRCAASDLQWRPGGWLISS